MSFEVCPICESQHGMNETTYDFTARLHSGQSLVIQLQAMQCSVCGEKIEAPEQAERNSEKIAEEKLRLQTNVGQES
jgi:YgiT-type zinc finger domain-containing protein